MSNLPRMSNGAIDWTYAGAQARLELLWNAKHPDGTDMFSLFDIAKDMGITRNAVAGRAHRCKLPARESPILPLGSGKRPQRQRTHASTGRRQGDGRLIGPTLDIPRRERCTGAQALPTTLVVVAEPAPAVSLGPVRACCWPMWPDGERPRVPWFCEKPSMAGKPYCPTHYAVCYHRVISHGEQTLRERIP